MNNYPLASPSWGEEELKAINKVVESGMLTMGPHVATFEREFAQFFGSRYALMVSSGSTANLLMIAALFYTQNDQLRLKRGDEVIVPAVSWSTTYFPLYQYGLKLKFVDIDPHTLNIDIAKLKAAISENTRAILAVNLLGNPNDFDELLALSKHHDLILLEDNCESMGAIYKGKFAGTFGVMGSFSSFFSHHISTMEGGCILTDNEELYHILLCLRAHGWTRNLPDHNLVSGKKSNDTFEESFKFVLPGYNARPLELSGAIGIEQLKKLPAFIKARRDNARYFQDLFQVHPYLTIQQELGDSSWFGFALMVKQGTGVTRSEIVAKLNAANIECRPIVTGNFVKNDVIKYFDYEVSGTLVNADTIDQHGFFVGNHHYDISDSISALKDLLD